MSADGFYFNVKQWLGDDAVLLMDWDARAMHLQLMCLAWQQDPPGTLPADEKILRRWIGNPSPQDWEERLRPQIARAWKISDGQWMQEGLFREWERQANNSQKRRAAANARWDKGRASDGEPAPKRPATGGAKADSAEDPFLSEVLGRDGEPLSSPDSGFSLSAVLKENAIFFEQASAEERASIWSVGVKLLRHEAFDDNKARAYLGKLISELGEKRVAEAIAQLSLKALPPADGKSYLVGILKGEANRRKGRGRVAL